MCEFELLHLRYVGRYDRSASAKVLIIQFVSLIASGSTGRAKGRRVADRFNGHDQWLSRV
jgi:hypothetical protein